MIENFKNYINLFFLIFIIIVFPLLKINNVIKFILYSDTNEFY